MRTIRATASTTPRPSRRRPSAARPLQAHGRAQLDLRPRHHPGRAHEDVELHRRAPVAGQPREDRRSGHLRPHHRVDQGRYHQGSPARGQVERDHLREGRPHPLPSRGSSRGQHHLRRLQGPLCALHLRRRGEDRPHARGDRPPEEAVHQEGDPARGLDRRAEGAESLIEGRHRR